MIRRKPVGASVEELVERMVASLPAPALAREPGKAYEDIRRQAIELGVFRPSPAAPEEPRLSLDDARAEARNTFSPPARRTAANDALDAAVASFHRARRDDVTIGTLRAFVQAWIWAVEDLRQLECAARQAARLKPAHARAIVEHVERTTGLIGAALQLLEDRGTAPARSFELLYSAREEQERLHAWATDRMSSKTKKRDTQRRAPVYNAAREWMQVIARDFEIEQGARTIVVHAAVAGGVIRPDARAPFAKALQDSARNARPVP